MQCFLLSPHFSAHIFDKLGVSPATLIIPLVKREQISITIIDRVTSYQALLPLQLR